MKIVKYKSNNVVVYANKNLTLDSKCTKGLDWVDSKITTQNATIEDVASIPIDWIGNAYSYKNGTWTLVKQDLVQPIIEQMSQTVRLEKKVIREENVSKITVEVSGKVFDGDETSQNRMARAILGMQITGQPTITWVLADNTITEATLMELSTALCLAGAKQAEIWPIVV